MNIFLKKYFEFDGVYHMISETKIGTLNISDTYWIRLAGLYYD